MKAILFGLILFFLTGCLFGDEPASTTHLTKDFWLDWWADSSDQHILLSTSEDGNGGVYVVEPTVYAVGFDNSFIIAKQHPDKAKEIQQTLFIRDSSENAYLLSDPKDSIWLADDDSVYKTNGKWYHISNGWNPPDSLKPYKAVTVYSVVDIRQYKRGKWESYKVYTLNTKEEFVKKCQQLGVSDNLKFTIENPSLE